MASGNLEQRVEELEQEVAFLRKRIAGLAPEKPWWEQIAGTFADDPIYEEAMKLGSEYRRAQRPIDIDAE